MNELIHDSKRGKFRDQLDMVAGWYIRGRRQWSFAHHAALYLSIFCTATAAVIPQLKDIFDKESSMQANLTTVFAAVGAFLISLSTSGSFSRKWRANRLSYGKISHLQSELMFREPTLDDTLRLGAIEDEHNRLIVGD